MKEVGLLAWAESGRAVGRHSLTLAYKRVFCTMAWAFLLALIMVPICNPAPQSAPVATVFH